MNLLKKVTTIAAAALIACTPAYGQNSGKVTNHAFAIGKGPNVTGFTSLLCGAVQFIMGTAGDPVCVTMGGDATLNGTGVLTLAASGVTAGSYTNSNVTVDSKGRVTSASSGSTGITQLTGDGTAGPGSGSQVFTLAPVNSNVGTFGSSTNCPTFTVNAKGLITAASQTACAGGGGGITQLTGDVTAGPGSGSQAATLASIVTAGGPVGSATIVPIITYDAKGRLTAVSSATVAPAIGSITGLGTGVATALGVATGSSGAPVLFNGAGGTPTSLVGTNITGTATALNIGGNAATATTASSATAVAVTGITGLGAGVGTALAIAVGSAGGPVTNGGALGTPTSGVGTNLTALNASNLGSGTVPAARLPAPTASTLGGIESLAAVSHQWINTISTSGVPSATQPACGDLSNGAASCSTDTTNAANISSGTLPAARLPLTSATLANGQPANPTGTTSTTVVSMGLGGTCKITPVYSGRVRFEVFGDVANSITSDTVGIRFYYGTGTPPANGAAPTGNQLSQPQVMTTTAGNAQVPFKTGGTTLTASVGTLTYFDVGLSSPVGGSASISNLTCEAWEY